MIYVIISILILLYYFFLAPKTIKNTLTVILMVGLVSVLLVLAALSFIRIMELPTEVFETLGMIALGDVILRDFWHLKRKE